MRKVGPACAFKLRAEGWAPLSASTTVAIVEVRPVQQSWLNENMHLQRQGCAIHCRSSLLLLSNLGGMA